MSPLRLSASQWIERHLYGRAAIVRGKRIIAARLTETDRLAVVDVMVEDPDVRCAVVDGRLDAEDMARVLTGFRGQPVALTPLTGSVRPVRAAATSAYVVDPQSGMAYLLV
jgi:hypothetical protein